MANCLKTQLKSSVQNDNLPKIGEIVITVVDPDIFNFYCGTSSPTAIVRASSPILYYVDSNGQKVGSAMSQCPIQDGVYNKGITVAEGFKGNIFFNAQYVGQDWILSGGYADFTYISNFRSLRSYNTEGGTLVTKFGKDTMFELYIYNQNTGKTIRVKTVERIQPKCRFLYLNATGAAAFVFDMSKFINNLPNLQIFRSNATTIENMSERGYADLGKIVSLINFDHNPRYSWTLEDFVANKRSVGVSSGTGNVNYAGDDSLGGVASFNGNKMSSSVTEFSWTATTITYNGTTIDA